KCHSFGLRTERCPDADRSLCDVQRTGSSHRSNPMLKIIATVSLTAALALPSAPAFAVRGNSSSYGSDGYGPTVPTQSLTSFQRGWNCANERKEGARAGAAWFHDHGGYGHYSPR